MCHPQSILSDGTLQWRVEFPKAKKRWIAKKKYATKSEDVLHDLMEAVYDTQLESLTKVPECVELFTGTRHVFMS